MLSFDQFKSEWLGKRVDYDHVFSFQCVDVVLQYIYECYGINGAYGNAIEWWTKTDSKLFAKFTKVDDGSVCKGDIAIFHTVGHTDFLGDGHIGIATGNGDPNSIEILEQNAVGSGTGLGRDAISTRFIARNRLAGVLRPLPVIPVNPCTYSLEDAPVTRLTRLSPTNWYSLNAATFNDIKPVTTLPVDTVFHVGGYAHRDNNTYAMSAEDYQRAISGDLSTNNGINIKDLKELPPPPPAPYKAPEVLVNIQDKMAEKYTLLTDLLCFPTAGNAASQTTPNGELAKGVYYVHGRDRDMINLSLGNMDRDVKQWINPRKNVVAVEEVKPVPAVPAPVVVPEKIIEAITVAAEKIPPAPVTPAVPAGPTPQQEWQQIATELAQHLSLFNLDGSPVHYNSNNSRKLFIEDMTGALDSRTGKVAVTMIAPFTKHIPMVGTIDIIEDDGRKIRYVLPAACYGTSKWYLAPMSSFNLDKKTVLDKAVDVVEGIYNDIRTSDHLTAAQERIKLSIQGFVNKMKKD